jgi:DNA-binding MarR family transcriptional regulator
LAPAIHKPRSLVIWFSPDEHVLTSLDGEAEVVAGEIYFAEGLANPLVKNLPTLLHASVEANAGLRFPFEQLLGKAAGTKPGWWERICDHLVPAEFNILRILRGSGETLSANELVARMVVRSLNAKVLLSELKKNGLIEAVSAGHFRITRTGRDRVAALDAPILEMHRQNLNQLTQAEKEELNRLLVKARQRCNGEPI